ncbi:hypothetical protein FACS189429_0690 [Bacteroidia bacterium]|nr:hypothetical protein FACS189429_0690 [Bacteroidia bacterium]
MSFASCGQQSKSKNQPEPADAVEAIDAAHNSMNSLNWDGTYTGTTPCADCEGIKTTLTLNENLTYVLETMYLGKSTKVNKTEGKFVWNTAGSIITLDNEKTNGGFNSQFFVGENVLWQLDVDGNKVEGEFAEQYLLHMAR